MYVLAFNGPPRCGKDTLSEMVANHMDRQGVKVPVLQVNLARLMRNAAFALIDQPNTDAVYDEIKEQPIPELGDTDFRHLMISMSEDWAKQQYGIDVWSRLLAARYDANHAGVLLIRDMGFGYESSFWNEWAGTDNFYLVRVSRGDLNFNNDSREHCYAFHDTDVSNDGTLDDLDTEAARIYGRLVNQLGWKL